MEPHWTIVNTRTHHVSTELSGKPCNQGNICLVGNTLEITWDIGFSGGKFKIVNHGIKVVYDNIGNRSGEKNNYRCKNKHNNMYLFFLCTLPPLH